MRQIERLPSNTAFEFFVEHYFEPNIPVIITEARIRQYQENPLHALTATGPS